MVSVLQKAGQALHPCRAPGRSRRRYRPISSSVLRGRRSRPASGPTAGDLVFLANASLVLPPYLFCGCRPWRKRVSIRVCRRSSTVFCKAFGRGISEAAGRYGDLRIRSKSMGRALALVESTGFPNPDLFDLVPIRIVAFSRPLHPRPLAALRSCSCGLGWNSIIFAFCQHGPHCARHLLGQRDRHEHPRLPG